MKAAWYERNGPANSVLILGDKPTPKPAKDEVLVKLATSGVNPSDVKSRAARPLAGSFVIPHSDGAGVIEAVGEGVDGSRTGAARMDMERTVATPDGDRCRIYLRSTVTSRFTR